MVSHMKHLPHCWVFIRRYSLWFLHFLLTHIVWPLSGQCLHWIVFCDGFFLAGVIVAIVVIFWPLISTVGDSTLIASSWTTGMHHIGIPVCVDGHIWCTFPGDGVFVGCQNNNRNWSLEGNIAFHSNLYSGYYIIMLLMVRCSLLLLYITIYRVQ